MLLEIGLALGLNVLTAASAAVPETSRLRPHSLPSVEVRKEAIAKPDGPKWAPNRMKILQLHRKGRWVARPGCPPVDKSFFLPIEKVEP